LIELELIARAMTGNVVCFHTPTYIQPRPHPINTHCLSPNYEAKKSHSLGRDTQALLIILPWEQWPTTIGVAYYCFPPSHQPKHSQDEDPSVVQGHPRSFNRNIQTDYVTSPYCLLSLSTVLQLVPITQSILDPCILGREE
jgi:hypothetical protein